MLVLCDLTVPELTPGNDPWVQSIGAQRGAVTGGNWSCLFFYSPHNIYLSMCIILFGCLCLSFSEPLYKRETKQVDFECLECGRQPFCFIAATCLVYESLFQLSSRASLDCNSSLRFLFEMLKYQEQKENAMERRQRKLYVILS